MPAPFTTRADDESILDILERRRRGDSHARIALDVGRSVKAIEGVIARIRLADIDHDPSSADFWRAHGAKK